VSLFITGTSKIYDLQGATVLPGINDVHVHPLEAGSEAGGTCELPQDTSPEKMISKIKKRYIKKTKPTINCK
jgi:predicted amidohydrolase YtcJ